MLKIEKGLTPLGQALLNVERVLGETTDFNNLDKILEEIRETDPSINYVRGYAGAWKVKTIKKC